jgi:hypothetical protein
MRILGIDPGTQAHGFRGGGFDRNKATYLASGVIRTGVGSLPARLQKIHQGIIELIDEYRPDVAVCEIVFVNVNPQSTLLLGQARGAAIGALVSRSLDVREYTALAGQAGGGRLWPRQQDAGAVDGATAAAPAGRTLARCRRCACLRRCATSMQAR